MTEDSVFLVTEAWVIPGTYDKFVAYRKAVNEAFAKYNPEYVHYNHAFEWYESSGDDELPIGMEVVHFANIELARAALADISTPAMKRMEKAAFRKVRSYLGKHSPPDWLVDEMQDFRRNARLETE